jgi:hypothetical protein
MQNQELQLKTSGKLNKKSVKKSVPNFQINNTIISNYKGVVNVQIRVKNL